MAVSTQRVIVLAIALNLLIGMFVYAYKDATGYDHKNDVLKYVTSQEDYLKNITANATGTTSTGLQTEQYYQPTYGNPVTFGGVMKLLLDGLNPFSIPEEEDNSIIVEFLIEFIEWFRVVIDVLFVLELYSLLINRKTP